MNILHKVCKAQDIDPVFASEKVKKSWNKTEPILGKGKNQKQHRDPRQDSAIK